MLLDERVFKDQRLELGRDENRVKVVDLRDHAARFLIVGGILLKILADAVFELFRLADVNDAAGLVHHQIDSRRERQVVRLVQKLLLCHGTFPPFFSSLHYNI